ncbi:DUF7848 domain-containing protein [Streptomyces apocyni]|uniref:DUF7848 domain-containing protein n=1 Tax=Streptomyces apocyni TaxID=2654677 RepID=UPI0012E9D2B4|nr:hypothetical protein [Streptomyces apocyni]
MDTANPRRRFAYAVWSVSADTRPGVPVGIFQIECMTCHAESPATDNDATPQQDWALTHTGRHPDHRGFKLTTETYWRVTPAADNPYAWREG